MALLLVVIFASFASSVLANSSLVENNTISIMEVKPLILPHSYEASIRFANRHVCNGAIISRRYILTAAHCFFQNGTKFPEHALGYMSVVTGFNADLTGAGNVRRIRNVTVQEDLRARDAKREYRKLDIALITLEEEMEYTRLEQPIDLPDMDVIENTRAKMSIWESPTDNLTTVDVFIMPHEKCAARLKEKYTGDYYGKICGNTRAGRGMCLNNAGSPLVQDGRLVGIASASNGCVNRTPDVYVNVFRSLAFVSRAIDRSAIRH